MVLAYEIHTGIAHLGIYISKLKLEHKKRHFGMMHVRLGCFLAVDLLQTNYIIEKVVRYIQFEFIYVFQSGVFS